MQDQTGRPLLRVRAARFISSALLICGFVLLLVAGGLQLRTFYAELRWQRGQEALSNQFLPAPGGQVSAAKSEPTPTPSTASTPTPPGEPTTSVSAAGMVEPSADQTAAATSPTQAMPRMPPTRTPVPAAPGDPGTLIIPKLKVNAPIIVVPLVNGQWDMSRILYEAALLAGTGFPGRPGNAAISGHISLRGRGDGPFRWLEKLQPDDDIIVQQDNMRYIYRVSSSNVVLPTDVSVLAPTTEATLTLITCTDWDFLKAEYSRRLIVKATLAARRDTSAPAQ